MPAPCAPQRGLPPILLEQRAESLSSAPGLLNRPLLEKSEPARPGPRRQPGCPVVHPPIAWLQDLTSLMSMTPRGAHNGSSIDGGMFAQCQERADDERATSLMNRMIVWQASSAPVRSRRLVPRRRVAITASPPSREESSALVLRGQWQRQRRSTSTSRASRVASLVAASSRRRPLLARR